MTDPLIIQYAITASADPPAGAAQLPMSAYCILAGGQVRTGLDDNLHYRRGGRATNAQLVERAVRLAAEFERPVVDLTQTRELLRSAPDVTMAR